MTGKTLDPCGSDSSDKLGQVIDAWAASAGVRFVNRSYGQQTTDTVSRSAMESLIAAAIRSGLDHGRNQAAQMAAERARSTEIVDGEPAAKLREAIAQRVADVGKPTAWAALSEGKGQYRRACCGTSGLSSRLFT